jgi:hypothetical protein
MDNPVATLVMYNFSTEVIAWGMDLAPNGARSVPRTDPGAPAEGRRSQQTGPRYRRKSRTSTGSTV